MPGVVLRVGRNVQIRSTGGISDPASVAMMTIWFYICGFLE